MGCYATASVRLRATLNNNVSLSIKENGLFCVKVLSDKIHLFALLHADVDITFLLLSFICVIAVKWVPNCVWEIQDTHFLFTHVDLQIQF